MRVTDYVLEKGGEGILEGRGAVERRGGRKEGEREGERKEGRRKEF